MTTDFIRQPRHRRPIVRHARAISRLAATLLLLMSCHSDQTGPGPVAVLRVAPTSLEVMVNEAVQLVAFPEDAAGTALSGRQVTWTIQEPLIAAVTSFGRVTGVSTGHTTLTAVSEGVTAEVPVSVIAAAGEVQIDVNKVGAAADPQGFRLLVDGQPLGDPLATVGRRLVELPVGMHTVRLEDIESRCELIGESSRVVFVLTRQRAALAFNIACRLPGQLLVKTHTIGQRIVNNPYRISVDGGADLAIDPDGELRFELPARKYQVALMTLDTRCLVGTARQEVGVFESIISTIEFQVRCYPEPPSLTGGMIVVSYGSSFGSGLAAMSLDGTLRLPIEDGFSGIGDAALSADGRRLAFRRLGAGGSHLVVLDVPTGTKSVSAGALHISGLSWSPDGQRLVTGLWNNGLTSIAVLRADGSLERTLGQADPSSVSAHWAPDGGTIAFTRNNHGVMLVNADGSNVRAIRSSPELNFDGARWSADGRTLLVKSYKQWCYYYSSYYCYPYDAHLIVLDAATGKDIRNIPIPEYAYGFVWGATSDEVYFIQAGDVFHARLTAFVPVNVTRSPEDEWSVLFGRFEGGAVSSAGRPRR
jgi:Bacterial Ig-like domain (group 2)